MTARRSRHAAGGLPRHNLPPLGPFFGRKRELAAVAEAVLPSGGSWGVVIDGPGGMGKTSLAVRAARAVARQFRRILFTASSDRHMSADGQRKLSDSVVPGYFDMLTQTARLLRRPEYAKLPPADRARALIQLLKAKPALLIFDNVESLPRDQQDKLFAFLGKLPEGSKAIVTCQAPADTDARVVRLAKLERQGALDLLDAHAEHQPLLDETEEAERLQIYEECGGNPLLMRWLAGELGRGSCQTVTEALEFLRRAPVNSDPLEYCLGSLLGTSNRNELKVAAALAHFSAPLELNAIAEVASVPSEAAQTALETLAACALVAPDDEKKQFTLAPAVADYFRLKRPELVRDAGIRLADRAHALVVEHGHGKHDRFDVLDAAWPTLAPALPILLVGPNARLQTACAALADFLNATGRWDERLSLCTQAEARAAGAGDYVNAGWRAYQAGYICYLREQAGDVLDWANKTTAHWQRAGARERAIAMRLRGRGHELKEDYPAAIAAYREALDLDQSVSAQSEDTAIALNHLAIAEDRSGDYEAAERDFREALRVAREVGYTEGVAIYTGNLAGLALDRENWQDAEKLAREALALSEKTDRQLLIAANCRRIATALLGQSKPPKAYPYARRAVDIYTRLGSPDLEEASTILARCEG